MVNRPVAITRGEQRAVTPQALLAWVAWFDHSRLLAPIGYVPPAEYEAAYDRRHETPAELATLT